MGIEYPIAIDSDYAIWNAFGNRYWPAFYFVDAQGQIRHHRFGEGEYGQSEMILQRLLAEAGSGGTDQDLVAVDATGVEAAADWASLRSPDLIDSDYAIWNAFGNRYWPAFYCVDAQGQIRHHRFGEGEYGQSEMILQRLLAEAGSGGTDQDLVAVDATGVEAAADWASLRS